MSVILSVDATAVAPQLRLRPWRLQDATALAMAHPDPQLRQRWQASVAGTLEARQWIERQIDGWSSGRRYGFAVQECAKDEPAILAGHVVVKTISDFESNAAEVGYWTAVEKSGRGIASRALQAVSHWMLTVEPGLRYLELLHAVDNPASCRVAEKSGYALHSVLPADPPSYPNPGHRHIMTSYEFTD